MSAMLLAQAKWHCLMLLDFFAGLTQQFIHFLIFSYDVAADTVSQELRRKTVEY
jgi:hypothetical protein